MPAPQFRFRPNPLCVLSTASPPARRRSDSVDSVWLNLKRIEGRSTVRLISPYKDHRGHNVFLKLQMSRAYAPRAAIVPISSLVGTMERSGLSRNAFGLAFRN